MQDDEHQIGGVKDPNRTSVGRLLAQAFGCIRIFMPATFEHFDRNAVRRTENGSLPLVHALHMFFGAIARTEEQHENNHAEFLNHFRIALHGQSRDRLLLVPNETET